MSKGGRPRLPVEVTRKRAVEHHFGKLLSHLTEELSEEEIKQLDLENTPARVARMLVHETLSYPDPPSTTDLCLTPVNASLVVTVAPIGFSSTCAHHVLPFTGHAWISYLANKNVMGLSKFTRVVRAFSKRLQIQEVLTQNVLEYLVAALEPTAMLVLMRAQHGCISCRGVEDPLQQTVTSQLYYEGVEDPDVEIPESIVSELYRTMSLATPTLK